VRGAIAASRAAAVTATPAGCPVRLESSLASPSDPARPSSAALSELLVKSLTSRPFSLTDSSTDSESPARGWRLRGRYRRWCRPPEDCIEVVVVLLGTSRSTVGDAVVPDSIVDSSAVAESATTFEPDWRALTSSSRSASASSPVLVR